MMELRDYDNAHIKFRNSLKFTMLPILSWDFYASNYEEIKNLDEDYNSLLSLVSTNSWNIDTSIIDRKLRTEKNIVVVTDTHLNIVFATKNMWNMSQYRPEEIVGKNPKMFQGDLTSNSTLKNSFKSSKRKKYLLKLLLSIIEKTVLPTIVKYKENPFLTIMARWLIL